MTTQSEVQVGSVTPACARPEDPPPPLPTAPAQGKLILRNWEDTEVKAGRAQPSYLSSSFSGNTRVAQQVLPPAPRLSINVCPTPWGSLNGSYGRYFYREVKIECPPTEVTPKKWCFVSRGCSPSQMLSWRVGAQLTQFGGAENKPGCRALLSVPAVLPRDKNWDKGCSRGPKMGQRLGFVPCFLSLPRQTQARDGG